MIPPVSPSMLEANTQFASLHRHLTTHRLNPDASTRGGSEAESPVSGALRRFLLQTAREGLLRSSLRNIAARSQERAERAENEVGKLSLELRDAVDTISMLLDEAPSTRLSEEDYKLLAPDMDAFCDHSEEVAGVVSNDLQRQHDLLCKIVSAPTSAAREPSPAKSAANSKRPLHRVANTTTSTTTTSSSSPSSASPESLSTLLQPLLPSIPNPALQSALSSLSKTTLQHATVHRSLLSTSLTQLERTTHGLHARHTKARSAHLSAVATALAKRIQMVYLQRRNMVYKPEVQVALRNYQRHLEEVMVGLEGREEELRAVLKEYDDVGQDVDDGQGPRGVMREVGRRYGEVLREIELVEKDIARLGEAVKRR